jgi:hypothetical protein
MFHVGENLDSGESPVGAAHPDPLFVKILQVDRIKQGVGGSQSGGVWGSVWTFPGIGARSVAGLGVGWEWEDGGFMGGVLDGFTTWGREFRCWDFLRAVKFFQKIF